MVDNGAYQASGFDAYESSPQKYKLIPVKKGVRSTPVTSRRRQPLEEASPNKVPSRFRSPEKARFGEEESRYLNQNQSPEKWRRDLLETKARSAPRPKRGDRERVQVLDTVTKEKSSPLIMSPAGVFILPCGTCGKHFAETRLGLHILIEHQKGQGIILAKDEEEAEFITQSWAQEAKQSPMKWNASPRKKPTPKSLEKNKPQPQQNQKPSTRKPCTYCQKKFTDKRITIHLQTKHAEEWKELEKMVPEAKETYKPTEYLDMSALEDPVPDSLMRNEVSHKKRSPRMRGRTPYAIQEPTEWKPTDSPIQALNFNDIHLDQNDESSESELSSNEQLEKNKVSIKSDVTPNKSQLAKVVLSPSEKVESPLTEKEGLGAKGKHLWKGNMSPKSRFALSEITVNLGHVSL